MVKKTIVTSDVPPTISSVNVIDTGKGPSVRVDTTNRVRTIKGSGFPSPASREEAEETIKERLDENQNQIAIDQQQEDRRIMLQQESELRQISSQRNIFNNERYLTPVNQGTRIEKPKSLFIPETDNLEGFFPSTVQGTAPTVGRITQERKARLGKNQSKNIFFGEENLFADLSDFIQTRDLTPKQKIRSVGESVLVGGEKLLIGLGDFAGKGFSNTISFDEEKNRKIPQIERVPFLSSKQDISRIRGEPTDAIQFGVQTSPLLIGVPSLVGSGIKIARTEGVIAGLQETASILAPIRPRPGIFTPKSGIVKETFISEGEIGIRNIKGSKLPQGSKIDSVGFDISSPKSSSSISINKADIPFLEINRGGTFDLGTESLVFGRVGRVRSIKSGSDELIAQGSRQFEILRGRQKVGKTPQIDLFTNLQNPQGNLLLERTTLSASTKGGNLQAGKFIDLGNTRSLEFGNFGRLSKQNKNFDLDSGFSVLSPATGIKKTSFGFDAGALLSPQLPKVKGSSQNIPNLLQPVQAVKVRSPFYGKGLYERTDQASLLAPRLGKQTSPFLDNPIKPLSINNDNFNVRQKRGNKRFRSNPLNDILAVPKSLSGLGSGLDNFLGSANTDQIQPRLKNESISRPPRGSSFSFTLPKSPKSGIFFGGSLPGLGFGDNRRRKVKPKKRKFRRTPSLISIELGITAPRPVRGEVTGLVSRPIIGRKRRRSSQTDILLG